jgi:eukaryotic-like serine/threonine-protein kinase
VTVPDDLVSPSRFRLLREVARGGMATVYEAEQVGASGFTKRMAVKIIHERFARHPEWLQLFIDEAKLSANLVHGNIVQIYQLGETAARPFHRHGVHQGPHPPDADQHPPRAAAAPAPRHRRLLRQPRLPRARLRPSLRGEDGNRLDIVHRDVSPGNVMLTWDGHVKLADFGIAKARTMADPRPRRPLLLGKKHYMSPEQLMGVSVDWRSDIFSMGVVLFELFALKSLFTEDETLAAIDEVVIGPTPDITSQLPGIDPAMRAHRRGAIQKEPGIVRAAVLGRSLDAWCAARGTPGSPERLQAHLADLFPETYRPPTMTGDDVPSISLLTPVQ